MLRERANWSWIEQRLVNESMPIKCSSESPPSFPRRLSFPFSSVDSKMSEEDWVAMAMKDDSLVADMLLRLNHLSPPPPLTETLAPALQFGWIVRQRRSKSFPRYVEADRKNEPMRASPTTPLSWSGATSASGGGTEGLESSCRLSKAFDGARSEIPVKIDDIASKKTKRTTRKKTLTELKDEESSLSKERRNLKNALISLRLNVEKHRAINESLKRLKSRKEIPVTSESTTPPISDRPRPQPRTLITESENREIADLHAVQQHLFEANFNLKLDANESFGSACFLPDLNLPFGDDSGSEIFR